MDEDDMPDPLFLISGFAAVKDARGVVLTHLRRMIAGEEPYTHFKDEHLLTRTVWMAAADLIASDTRAKNRR